MGRNCRILSGMGPQSLRGGIMQSTATRILLVLLLALALSGCAVAGGIFKGGMAVGIFVAVVVIILVFVLFGRRG